MYACKILKSTNMESNSLQELIVTYGLKFFDKVKKYCISVQVLIYLLGKKRCYNSLEHTRSL